MGTRVPVGAAGSALIEDEKKFIDLENFAAMARL